MLSREKILILLPLVILFFVLFIFLTRQQTKNLKTNVGENLDVGSASEASTLSIDALKKGNYPGSDFKIEETLVSGSNYKRYIASYKSDGLKIYGLLTVPDGVAPKGGWPAIIFNHGFIPPQQYVTTERYVAYQDGFAKEGYVTFKSDYRGHGNSEGKANGGYGSNDYTIDVLNAISSVERLSYVNKNKIGMWGHSMGGFLTLRALIVRPEIKASVIWGGVVVSYPDLLSLWHRRTGTPVPSISGRSTSWRNALTAKYGTPQENPAFWNSISANSYLKNITGPIQLDYGEADEEVPPEFSKILYSELKSAGKTAEIYGYPGDDHNISENFSLAMQRSVGFFDKYLK